MQRFVARTFALVSLLAAAPLAHADAGQKPSWRQAGWAAGTFATASKAVPGAEAAAAVIERMSLDGLTAQSSFPLAVVVGPRRDEDWRNLPKAAEAPRGLSKRYEAGACSFTLATGAYGVRILRDAGHGEFTIDRDAVGARTILDGYVGQARYLSVVAELEARIAPGSEAACQKLFVGKRMRFARASLAGSSLSLSARKGGSIEGETAAIATETDVYLSWDGAQSTLRVTDKAGLAVAVESDVFSFNTTQEGVFHVALEPSWKMERVSGDKRVAHSRLGR